MSCFLFCCGGGSGGVGVAFLWVWFKTHLLRSLAAPLSPHSKIIPPPKQMFKQYLLINHKETSQLRIAQTHF